MRIRLIGLTVALAIGAHVGLAQPTAFSGGVVAADHELASTAGAAMLAKGGNAVDAAIATSFALSVVRPMSCGIGGGGFMLIYDPNAPEGEQAQAFNYRETAPLAVGPEFFSTRNDPDASRTSGAAVGVPGTVAGLWAAHQAYGSLPWRDLLQPAIEAAEHGFPANDDYIASAKEIMAWYAADPAREKTHPFVWHRFLREGMVEVGDVITNPEQGKALRLIAEHGPEGFYEGPVAKAIVKASEKLGGVITQNDLESYEPRRETPLTGAFFGREVFTMPPPSSGGIATIQALGALEQFSLLHDLSLGELAHNQAEYIHVVAEIMKHVFADRAAFLADTAFVEVPVDQLLSPASIQSIAQRIDRERVLKGNTYGLQGATAAIPDDAGTSHISVIDASGMAVACTETINLTFGSRIAVDEYGFCLNNEMDDFTTAPGAVNAFGLRQSERNLPRPGMRPLSSMSPTIIVNDRGDVELITGARGGPRIITATIQTILNALVFGMSATDAVAAPRFHHQWSPPFLAMEPPFILNSDTEVEADPEALMKLFQSVTDLKALSAGLQRRGHLVGEIPTVGVVELILRSPDGYVPAADPRGGGAPAAVDDTGTVVTVVRE